MKGLPKTGRGYWDGTSSRTSSGALTTRDRGKNGVKTMTRKPCTRLVSRPRVGAKQSGKDEGNSVGTEL